MQSSSTEVVYCSDVIPRGNTVAGRSNIFNHLCMGDVIPPSATQPLICDITYGSSAPCILYGVCPVFPVPEGVEGELNGAKVKTEEADVGDESDHPHLYPLCRYLPSFPPQHIPPYLLPPTAALPPNTPARHLGSPPLPSPPQPSSPQEKYDAGECSLDVKFSQGHEDHPVVPTDVVPPSPPQFVEESKLGVFGPDGCWYSIAEPQTNQSSDDPSGIPPLENPLYISMLPPDAPYVTHLKNSDMDPECKVQPCPPVVLGGEGEQKEALMGPGVLYYNCFQRVDLPVDTFGRPRLLPTIRKEGKMSLEDLWVNHMSVLFKHLPDKWVLVAAQPGKRISSSWFTFRDLAKVRFYCKHCHDGWTSMYGVVIFHYRWNKKLLQGQVVYKIPGQKCGGACDSETFELPLWYPEEAQKVITNLYYKIAGHYYDLVTPQYIKTRRFGRPGAHHNRDLCEGCSQGVCKVDATREGR